jgi:hypothetical protein
MVVHLILVVMFIKTLKVLLTNGLVQPVSALMVHLIRKASAGRSAADYKGLNAVCNELAGTTGLSAIPALREVAS